VKTFIFVIVVLFVSVLATLYAIHDPGYVLIARAPWSIEMPLTLFVPLLLLAVVVLSFLWRMLRLGWHLPEDVAGWRLRRRGKKARAALTRGLVRLAEGNWDKAQAELIAGLAYSDSPLINYLGAACAAQARGDTEKRDEYIALAQRTSPENGLAIGMTQAHLYSWTEQHEQALAILSALHAQAPKQLHILRLLLRTYMALNDWGNLAKLLPELRKHEVLPADTLNALELQAHRELLSMALPVGSPELLRQTWSALPKTLRQQPTLIAIYAHHLIRQNQMNEAEALLREAIRQSWDDTLVELYGRSHTDHPAAQLETAEAWLKGRPDNPSLLLTLGRLAVRNQLWGKARSFLETCLRRRPTPEAYRELAALMDQLNEPEKALDYYRRGLELVVSEKPVKPPRLSITGGQRRRATG
jgi:HemY protein